MDKLTTTPYPYRVGDMLYISMEQATKWNRLMYWLFKTPLPCSERRLIVTEVCSDTEVIIKPAIMDDPAPTLEEIAEAKQILDERGDR